jgi:hypothetical protein
MSKELNYEKDIRIDPEALDVEWLNQPHLFLTYARNSANMRKSLDEAKQSLDIAKAEADKKIRTNPEKYGLEKITESVVANAILIENGYKAAFQEYLDAKYEADMASAAVQAMEQKKSALENLVRLYGQSYFAGPKVPRNLTEELERNDTQTNSGVARGLNRKTK